MDQYKITREQSSTKEYLDASIFVNLTVLQATIALVCVVIKDRM
jgi:hypothetical protein